MPTVRLTWDAVTTRASGKPIKPGDIAGYKIEASHEDSPFVTLPDPPAGATTVDAPADYGKWRYRVSCFDTKNKVGAAGEASIDIEDDTPPGAVLNLSVSVVASLATSQG